MRHKLNELNFQRFDANVEQRMVVLEARLEKRMDTLEPRVNQRMDGLEVQLNQRIVELRADLRTGAQIRWMAGFWLGTLIPLAGLMLALQRKPTLILALGIQTSSVDPTS